MDEMLITELQNCLDNIQYADRSLWESSRISSYLQCQMNTKKKLKLTDIYKLPFDELDEPQTNDIAELQRRAAALDDIVNAK